MRSTLPIRVLLAHLPAILSDVFRQVLDRPDVQVVGVTDSPVETLLHTGSSRAEVVVLGISPADLPGLAAQLVDEYPHVNVLAVTPDARSAFLYSLRPELVALGTATPQRLLAAIRATGADPPGGISQATDEPVQTTAIGERGMT
jgi:DNA-binding NarL/FixJ family response regulator